MLTGEMLSSWEASCVLNRVVKVMSLTYDSRLPVRTTANVMRYSWSGSAAGGDGDEKIGGENVGGENVGGEVGGAKVDGVDGGDGATGDVAGGHGRTAGAKIGVDGGGGGGNGGDEPSMLGAWRTRSGLAAGTNSRGSTGHSTSGRQSR